MKPICDLNKISKRTDDLWNKVVSLYGRHVFTLGVNGIGQIVLIFITPKKSSKATTEKSRQY